MAEMLDGLLTFFASHHAIRAEKTLRLAGLPTRLIPGPKELSPNCGVALRFVYAQREAAMAILSENNIRVDEVQPYSPLTDSWKKPESIGGHGRRFFRRDRQ